MTEDTHRGRLVWYELATTDHSAACDFYSELFGWKKHEAMVMGDGWMYQIDGRERWPHIKRI